MRRNPSMSGNVRLVTGLFSVILLVGAIRPALAAEYLGPTAVAASKDGKRLFVANTDARQVATVEIGSRKVLRTTDVPAPPTGLVLEPTGKTLYVTCAAPKSIVCGIDIASGKVIASIPVGHTAIGPAISPDGMRLYVCNRFDNNVAVIDLAAKKLIAEVPTVREPFAAAVTPDGKSVFVVNHLPLDQADAYDVACEVAVVNAADNTVSAIRLPNGSSGGRGICVAPDGKHVYVTHILARYQMPTTQLERGWMNTNALSILDAEGKTLVNTVLLDDVDLGAANPWGVTTTDDGSRICVSHAGTHEISLIDAPGLIAKLEAMPSAEEAAAGKSQKRGVYAVSSAEDVPNDLSFLVDLRRRIRLNPGYLFQQVPQGVPELSGPRGLAVVGTKAYAAVYFSDALAEVDLTSNANNLATRIPLGPRPKLSTERLGQKNFNDAKLCFQHWQSCASCHPDARVDGLNWDLLNDGLGNPKNAKSMLLAHRTPPAMVSGVRGAAEDAIRAGITHIQFAVRPESDAVAIDAYLKSLEPVPSPHLVDGKLSQAAERGKELFFSDKIGCAKCHPAPLYTDLRMHNVGSKGRYDRRHDFDTPTLVEVWRTAPYMHDGQYLTIQDLIAKGKHGAMGGDIESLTEPQLQDLAEFVLSL